MTVPENSAFPLGYFYIVSKLNDLVLDIRGDPDKATVSPAPSFGDLMLLSNVCL